MRILLVEDDPTTSRSIELMLTHANLNVYCTDMGEDGMREASDLRFIVGVRDTAHLEIALRNLRRTPSVLRAQRSSNGAN